MLQVKGGRTNDKLTAFKKKIAPLLTELTNLSNSLNSKDFHFNASLAAVNLAKAACKRLGITYSISSCKSFIHNAYMLERFICVFGISPDPQVIDKLFKELILFTARAA